MIIVISKSFGNENPYLMHYYIGPPAKYVSYYMSDVPLQTCMNSYLVGLKSKDGGLCIILHLLPYCKNASNETVLLSSQNKCLTLYLIETPLNTFVNRADPDQAALVRATLFAYGISLDMIPH